MTDIQYILEVIRPQYLVFKSDGVMRLSPEDNVKVRAIYQTQFGRPMGTCNNCFAEQLLSLIVKCEGIEKATIATDEQKVYEVRNGEYYVKMDKTKIEKEKKKFDKKKIEDPFKGIKIDI